MRVEITMEKVQRVAMEFDVTEEQLEQLQCGDNPFYEAMEKEIENGDLEYDYAVADMYGETLVDWD